MEANNKNARKEVEFSKVSYKFSEYLNHLVTDLTYTLQPSSVS